MDRKTPRQEEITPQEQHTIQKILETIKQLKQKQGPIYEKWKQQYQAARPKQLQHIKQYWKTRKQTKQQNTLKIISSTMMIFIVVGFTVFS